MSHDTKQISESQQFSTTLVEGAYLKTGCAVQLYENALRFKDETRKPSSRPRTWVVKREKCKEFTNQSRLRMMKLFNRLRVNAMSQACFVTFTYHYGHTKNPAVLHAHRNHILTRLRQLYPGCHYVWRIEFQERGAPHIHLIFWGANNFNPLIVKKNEQNLKRMWHEMADPNSLAHEKYGCDIRPCTSHRQVFAYVCKYVSKVSDESGTKFEGRRWGASTNLPCEYHFDFEVERKTWDYMQDRLRKKLEEAGKTGWLSEKLYEHAKDIEVFCSFGEMLLLLKEALEFTKDVNASYIFTQLHNTS